MLGGSEQSGGQMSAFASTSAELAGSGGGEVPASACEGGTVALHDGTDLSRLP